MVERGVAYRQGRKTDLEPGPLRTFGVERNGDRVRIVWYFDASNETRAFTISYTLIGVAVGYDDVVDVNLKVWGDQWDEPLARLEAEMTRAVAPFTTGGEVRFPMTPLLGRARR